MTTMTFKIPERNLGTLTAALGRLDRRAAKLGVPGLTVTFGERVEVAHRDEITGVTRVRVHIPVTIAGETPKLAGWTFAATLDHASEAGNVLRAVPGAPEIPVAYREVGPSCDHCRLPRARRDTYLVVHDDGRWAQVGSTCLIDFLGEDATRIAARAEFLAIARTLGEECEGFGGGGSDRVLWVETILTIAAAAVTRLGWTSRKVERETSRPSTASDVEHELYGPAHCRDHGKHALLPPTETEKAEAVAALEWARGLRAEDRTLSDYEHNLVVATASETTGARNLGLLVSIIPAYRRAVERELRRRRAAETSIHVGTVGKREVFTATLVHRIEVEGTWGTSSLHKFLTPEGGRLTWFATKERLDTGTTYRLRATVKRHEEFRGIKETVITRAVVEATIEDTEPNGKEAAA